MARASRTVNLKVTGDISALRKAIAAMPKEMAREAQKSLSKIEAEGRKAAASLERITKPKGTGLKDAKEGLEGIKAGLEGVGLAGAPATDGLIKITESAMKLGAVGGPVGIAVGAAATAVLALGAAGVTAALSSGALLKELDELGRSDAITDEQRARVGAMDLAIRELSIAAKEATIAVGSDFAPAITGAATALASAVVTTMQLYDAWMDLGEAVEPVSRVLRAVGSLGISEAMRDNGQAAVAFAEGARQAESAIKAQHEELVALGKGLETGEVAQRKVEDASIDLAGAQRDLAAAQREAAAAAAEEARAQAEAASVFVSAYQAALSAEQADTEATQRAIDEARRNTFEATLERQQVLSARDKAAADEATARAEAGRAQLEASVEAMPGAFETLAGLIGEAATQAADIERTALDRAADRQRQQVAAQLERGQIDERQASARMRQIDQETQAERRAIRQREDARKKSAKVAFAAYKAGAIAQAVADGAKAYVAVLGAPAIASLGPFAPAAAAAITVPATAAQVGVIAAQKPSFHGGGMSAAPDDIPATLRRGEGVLTPQGVARAGGAEGVAALNTGGSTVQSGPTIINLRLPDGTTATTTTRGGSTSATLRTTPGQRAYDGRS